MAALREDVLLGHGKMPRDDAQDVLDLDAAWLDALHEVADDRLGNVERDGRAHQLPGELEPVDDVLELLLGLLAAHEFEVIDEQDVDRPELVLEGHGILALDGLDELVAEALCRQIEDAGLGCAPLHLPGNGMLEMRLAEPDAGVKVEGIEAALLGKYGLGDLDCCGMRHAVG